MNVLVEKSGGIARVTLNRPEVRNAFDDALISGLAGIFSELDADPATRVVVLAGNGPAFCAGHDLKELTEARAAADRGRSFFKLLMRQCSSLMLSVVRHPKPVIADVVVVEERGPHGSQHRSPPSAPSDGLQPLGTGPDPGLP